MEEAVGNTSQGPVVVAEKFATGLNSIASWRLGYTAIHHKVTGCSPFAASKLFVVSLAQAVVGLLNSWLLVPLLIHSNSQVPDRETEK